MYEDGFACVQAGDDFGLEAGSAGLPYYLSSSELWDPATGQWTLLTDSYVALAGDSAVVHEYGPVIAIPEEGGEGQFRHPAAFPEHDAYIDLKAVGDA